MTSLADFIAIGKECGLIGDKLLAFAEAKLEAAEKKAKELEEKKEKKAKELEEKKRKRSERSV